MRTLDKERCKHGHLLKGANLRIKIRRRKQSDGTVKVSQERVCVECHRLENKVYAYNTKVVAAPIHIDRSMFRPKYREPSA